MEIFYAFCRAVDDLADEPGLAIEARMAGLDRWRNLVEGNAADPSAGIEAEFADLLKRRELDRTDLHAILDGMEMDLTPQTFTTEAELRRYCYHVAGAVGLVSVDLFGSTDPGARDYAEELGYALQWTNILRDVAEDARGGRIFLPTEDLAHFGLSPAELLDGKPDAGRFRRLMRRETAVARAHYREALAIFAALPSPDRAALRSAELMRRIYSHLLDVMEKDGFRVYETRYRPGKIFLIGEFLRAKYLA